MSCTPNRCETCFDIECIVVNLAVSTILSWIQRPHIFILADIVTECIVNRIIITEHDRTCCISMAVVVLIVCSITIVSIPRLSIAVTIGGV